MQIFIKISVVIGRQSTQYTFEIQIYTKSLSTRSLSFLYILMYAEFFLKRREVVWVRSIGASLSANYILLNEFLSRLLSIALKSSRV